MMNKVPGGGRSRGRPGFKIGKHKLHLCVRDECGTWLCDESHGEADGDADVLRTTSLGRELRLSEDLAILYSTIRQYRDVGMYKWEAYRDRRETIWNTIRIIKQSIRRYKERRVEAGLFYLVPKLPTYRVLVRTDLHRMPVRQAIRRRRLRLQKRQELLALYDKRSSQQTSPASLSPIKRLFFSALCSIVLGCIIVFI